MTDEPKAKITPKNANFKLLPEFKSMAELVAYVGKLQPGERNPAALAIAIDRLVAKVK